MPGGAALARAYANINRWMAQADENGYRVPLMPGGATLARAYANTNRLILQY